MIVENLMNFFGKVMMFTGFVNTTNGFEKPLNEEEEKMWLEKLQEGDDEARQMLIKHNLRLVAHIVKKYNTAGEADDLISVGCIGLIKAINTYKMDKGTQLSTYAARCIENEMLMLIRVGKKHSGVYSLEESLGTDKDGNDVCLQDVIGSEVDELDTLVENKILAEQLQKVLQENLPHREYLILCLRYGLNGTAALTQIEVAKKLNISRSYISRLENKAVETLRKANLKDKFL